MMSEFKANYTVYGPGFNPLATTEAREEYIQSLRRQGKISAELETSIREDLPITAAKRHEIEDAKYRALADTEWLRRHRLGGQTEKSEFTEWKGWLGRRVEG
jgi:hypothetical protein